MPTKPKRPCQHAGCSAFAIEGASRCVLHVPEWQAKRQAWFSKNRIDTRPSSSARGYDREWQRIRNAVIAEHPICQRCNVTPSRDVHHIRALRQGGTHDRGNLVALCRSCHLSVERAAVTR